MLRDNKQLIHDNAILKEHNTTLKEDIEIYIDRGKIAEQGRDHYQRLYYNLKSRIASLTNQPSSPMEPLPQEEPTPPPHEYSPSSPALSVDSCTEEEEPLSQEEPNPPPQERSHSSPTLSIDSYTEEEEPTPPPQEYSPSSPVLSVVSCTEEEGSFLQEEPDPPPQEQPHLSPVLSVDSYTEQEDDEDGFRSPEEQRAFLEAERLIDIRIFNSLNSSRAGAGLPTYFQVPVPKPRT